MITLPHAMTPLQARAYADPWSQNHGAVSAPNTDALPSGEVIGLSINL